MKRYKIEHMCLNTCRLHIFQDFDGFKAGEVLDYWVEPHTRAAVRLDYRNGKEVFKRLNFEFDSNGSQNLADVFRKAMRRNPKLVA